MGDIVNHKASLDLLNSVSHELQSVDTSVPMVVAQISDRYHKLLAKVLL